MTKAQAQILVDGAIEFLCQKHGVTAEQIAKAAFAGDMSVINQMTTLLTAGMGAVAQINAA